MGEKRQENQGVSLEGTTLYQQVSKERKHRGLQNMHFQFERAQQVANKMNENRYQGILQSFRIPERRRFAVSIHQGMGDGELQKKIGNQNSTGINSSLEVRRQWSDSFKIQKEHYPQPKTAYPAKLSIKYDDRRHFQICMVSKNIPFLYLISGICQNL